MMRQNHLNAIGHNQRSKNSRVLHANGRRKHSLLGVYCVRCTTCSRPPRLSVLMTEHRTCGRSGDGHSVFGAEGLFKHSPRFAGTRSDANPTIGLPTDVDSQIKGLCASMDSLQLHRSQDTRQPYPSDERGPRRGRCVSDPTSRFELLTRQSSRLCGKIITSIAISRFCWARPVSAGYLHMFVWVVSALGIPGL
jgi:hypothetical protein